MPMLSLYIQLLQYTNHVLYQHRCSSQRNGNLHSIHFPRFKERYIHFTCLSHFHFISRQNNPLADLPFFTLKCFQKVSSSMKASIYVKQGTSSRQP